jgi:hypothetical protein
MRDERQQLRDAIQSLEFELYRVYRVGKNDPRISVSGQPYLKALHYTRLSIPGMLEERFRVFWLEAFLEELRKVSE